MIERSERSDPSDSNGLGVRACLAALGAGISLLAATGCSPHFHPVVGCKNFTEQVLLGEMLVQQIEARTGLKVDRSFYLAGSYICNQALLSGRIDLYPEYTGTALMAILKQPIDRNPARVLATIRRLYHQRYHIAVGPPFGFNNPFAMVIRRTEAQRLHVTTLSEAARYTPHWKLAIGYEFQQRPDGLRGLEQTYKMRFAGPPRIMDLGLIYRALRDHQVDMVAGNATDGQILAYHLQVLIDDKHYFPPYQTVPLVREQSLQKWPGIGAALDELANKISGSEMQRMNEAVEGRHLSPALVVRKFRQAHGLLR